MEKRFADRSRQEFSFLFLSNLFGTARQLSELLPCETDVGAQR